MNSTAFIVILCTCGTRESAESIGRALVDLRLAACVSILPNITSIYRWRGETKADSEHLLLIKTAADSFERVAAAIRERHSYEVPEIVALPITKGDDAYLWWLSESIES